MRKSHVKGRFDRPVHAFFDRFGASVGFDRKMWRQDILGSIAHAEMLGRQGILKTTESKKIVAGLKKIARTIESGAFAWSEELEDVHMNIESALIEAIGPVGGKLHTGRSRNDQVATDLRLWLRDAIDEATAGLFALREALLDFAETHLEVILPGYTHLQRAQPIRLGHWAHAYERMFDRDAERLRDARARLNRLPLGSAALAGTPHDLDRGWVAERLGFDSVIPNSLDAVSDRDFALEFLSASAQVGIHLSRFCEEVVMWCSQEFGFLKLDDAICTGSSIMPQKKNPDLAELIRGKSARLIGDWTAMASLLKSQPLAYNKDLQEDKEPVFDSAATLIDCLEGARLIVVYAQPNAEKMLRACSEGFLTATDLADYLVQRGLDFRSAHSAVGKAVAHAASREIGLEEIPLATYRKWEKRFDADLFKALDIRRSVEARKSSGGTAQREVKKAVAASRRGLAAQRKRFDARNRCPIAL